MALKVIAAKKQGELTTAKEVVDLVGCPFDATARVLQQLAQREVLRSEQGAHGGYSLTRDLAEVSVFDLMEIVLGPMRVAKCLQHEAACELIGTCNITSPVAALNRRLQEFYQNVSVGDLLRLRVETSRPRTGKQEARA